MSTEKLDPILRASIPRQLLFSSSDHKQNEIVPFNSSEPLDGVRQQSATPELDGHGTPFSFASTPEGVPWGQSRREFSAASLEIWRLHSPRFASLRRLEAEFLGDVWHADNADIHYCCHVSGGCKCGAYSSQIKLRYSNNHLFCARGLHDS